MELALLSDEEILAVADPIMDNLMAASTAIDHARHVRDFTERARAQVTPEHLRQVCERYQAERGLFARRKPVAIFRRPDSVVVVWKQWFTREPGEYVAELLLVEQDGGCLVDHVMLF